jgi:hypothetical protein
VIDADEITAMKFWKSPSVLTEVLHQDFDLGPEMKKTSHEHETERSLNTLHNNS